jgi:hypothetical protein
MLDRSICGKYIQKNAINFALSQEYLSVAATSWLRSKNGRARGAICGGGSHRGSAESFSWIHRGQNSSRASIARARRPAVNANLSAVGIAQAHPGVAHLLVMHHRIVNLKVGAHAFATVVPLRHRTQLRQHAVAALCKLFERQPPPYNDAAKVLQDFDDLEWNFQERLHQASFPQLPVLDQDIWAAFRHALHPSLSRNGAFSYVIHSLHPYARSRAGVFFFDRRKFLQRLTSERPGQLVFGGRHPKWVTPDGLKVQPVNSLMARHERY